MHAPQPAPAPRGLLARTIARLRLASPELDAPAAPPPLTPQLTLTELFAHYYRPEILADAKPRNVDQYVETLRLWAAITGDPPVEAITRRTCADFQRDLATRPGRRGTLRRNTLRKHLIHLQAILDRLGAPGPRRRDGFRLLAEPPFFKIPKPETIPPSRIFTLAEIAALLASCHRATAPDYLAPTDRAIYWRSLLLTTYNLGLRIGSATALAWHMLQLDNPDGRPDCAVVPTKTGERLVYINAPGRAALDAMRPLTGDRERVFDWPHGHHWLQAQRRRILAAAAIPPARRFGFHAIRAAFCTHAAAISVMAASMQAGHKSERTTRAHYIDPGIVAATLEQLPQPTA